MTVSFSLTVNYNVGKNPVVTEYMVKVYIIMSGGKCFGTYLYYR